MIPGVPIKALVGRHGLACLRELLRKFHSSGGSYFYPTFDF